jgi:olefin beta-lactone synthetase
MNIAQVLHDQAAARGTQLAIVDGRESLTFSALNDASADAAAALEDAGLRPDDRALVFCPMSTALYVTLIGMFRLGVTAVFVDPSAGTRHVAACCARLRPRAFAATPRAHLLRLASRAIRRVPIKLAIGGGVPAARPVAATPAQARSIDRPVIQHRDASSPALITFTSGSTGAPKAAVRSHGLLLAQHRALARELELRAGDVDLTTLPMFVLANLASGVTSVIPDGDLRQPAGVDPVRLVQRMRRYGCTRIAASPALLQRIADHLAQSQQRLDISRVFTGGGPVFPGLLDALAAVAPGAAIAAVYGSTEAEPIARLRLTEMSDADRDRIRQGRGLPSGHPISSIDLRIVPDTWGTPRGPYSEQEFDSLSLPPNRAGEIVVAGAHVLGGYLDASANGETKISVGDRVWHRTGDAGYLDPSGRLWLLGRCGARIADEQGVTYPFTVEAAASGIPGVRRTAFVLHRRRRVLVVEIDAEEANAAASLERHLAWARLDDIRVVDRVPVDRRHNAKIDYPALETLLADS